MTLPLNETKVLEVVNPAAGEFREVQKPRVDAQDVLEVFAEKLGRRGVSLHEAATILEEAPLATPDFPQLLRAGLKGILFSEYAGLPTTHEQWINTEPSDQEFVTGIEGSNLGKLPKVAEGAEYPEIIAKLNRSVQIQNEKRGATLAVTWEMIRYDRIGIIRDLTRDLAGAMAYTEEDDAYTALRTAGSYVRNSTTNDNDIGANTGAVQFGPVGLTTANKTLVTMKDNKSGRYLGVMPDCLCVGVGLEIFARQLLTSPQIVANGDPGSTHALYGQGTTNPFRGMINHIIVTPFLTQYEWVLCQRGRFMKKFVVQDLELLDGTQSDWSYKTKKTLTYRADKVYGIGMWNDRYAFYSTGGAGPLVG